MASAFLDASSHVNTTTNTGLSPVNLSSQAQQFLQYQQMQMQIIQQQNPRLSAKFQRHKELPVAQDASIPVVMAQPVMDVAVAGTYNHDDKEPIDEDEEEEEEEEKDDAPPSMINQMHALNDLKAQGIITEEHFEAARKCLQAIIKLVNPKYLYIKKKYISR